MDHAALSSLLAALREAQPVGRLIVFGSTTLLVSFPNVAPTELGVDTTLDTDLFAEPTDRAMGLRLVEHFGEGRAYHRANGVYADVIDERVSLHFPEGWRGRLVPVPGCQEMFALHPSDAAAMKLFATAAARLDRRMGRRPLDRGLKDINVVVHLARKGFITWPEVAARLVSVDWDRALRREFVAVLAETEAAINAP